MNYTNKIEEMAKYFNGLNMFNSIKVFDDMVKVDVNPKDLILVLSFFKSSSNLKLDTLLDITCVDYKSYKEMVYVLVSIKNNARVMISVKLPNIELNITSANSLYMSSVWLEREVCDMFGVFFNGNVDLRRILLDYGFEGHPLCKGFPLEGFNELRYSDLDKRIVYEPNEFNQGYRNYTFSGHKVSQMHYSTGKDPFNLEDPNFEEKLATDPEFANGFLRYIACIGRDDLEECSQEGDLYSEDRMEAYMRILGRDPYYDPELVKARNYIAEDFDYWMSLIEANGGDPSILDSGIADHFRNAQSTKEFVRFIACAGRDDLEECSPWGDVYSEDRMEAYMRIFGRDPYYDPELVKARNYIAEDFDYWMSLIEANGGDPSILDSGIADHFRNAQSTKEFVRFIACAGRDDIKECSQEGDLYSEDRMEAYMRIFGRDPYYEPELVELRNNIDDPSYVDSLMRLTDRALYCSKAKDHDEWLDRMDECDQAEVAFESFPNSTGILSSYYDFILGYSRPSLVLVLPEIYMVVGILLLLTFGLLIKEKVQDHISIWYGFALQVLATGFVLYNSYQIYLSSNIFEGSYLSNPYLVYSKMVLLSILLVQVLLGVSYIKNEKMRYYEYYVIVLLVLLGLLLLISSNDLITLYLLMELQSLGFYLLIVFKAYTAFGVEASLKYLIVGAFTSGIYLFGFSIFYSYTGLYNFDDIAIYLALVDSDYEQVVVMFSVVLIIFSILFKLGVFPLHMWLPDVYEGAPTIVTLMLAILPKFGFLILLIKLLLYTFVRIKSFIYLLMSSSILGSWLVGSGGALYQVKLKRFLAYSAISNMGFILLGLLSNNLIGFQAALLYTLIYIILTLTVFSHVLELRYENYNKTMKLLKNFMKLSKVNMPLVYSMTLTFFSMAGIPPLSGFIIKFYVFYAGISNGLYFFMLLGVVFSVISVVYYLRVIRLMHFTRNSDYVYLKPISYLSSNIICLLSGLSVVIFLFPELFFNLTCLMVLCAV